MAMEQPILVTEDEKQKIQTELTELITVKRPEIARKIGRAAADGDLSENGAYHDAKEQQGHIEGRIQRLEYLVRNAVVVEPQKDVIGIGSTVHLRTESGTEQAYRLVSIHGARPSEGLLSGESPLGQSLLGHSAGETVTYATPNGAQRSVEILRIE